MNIKNIPSLLIRASLACVALAVGSAENSVSAQTIIITGTNITDAVTIMPQYVPPIENSTEWPVYASNSFAVATGAAVPNRAYLGWSNVVIAATFDPSKCTLGPGAPAAQGRLGFGAVITPTVAGSKISASMLYGVLASNDGGNNAFGQTIVPSSYALECQGRIFGQNNAADTWITSGSSDQLVDAIYWTPGPAEGFVANNSGDYTNILAYIAQYHPFTVTCTIYVVDSANMLRAGGGANSQGIAAVSTQVSPATIAIATGSSPGTALLSIVGGSANVVYPVYGIPDMADPFSAATYVGMIPGGGTLQIPTSAMPAQFLKTASN